MLLLEWNDEYRVGVHKFDDQHKKMFNIINDFYSAMKEGKQKDKIDEILKELIEYANYHLSEEEKYFEKFNYPKKEEHQKIHDTYREKINLFLKEYNENKSELISFDIIDYLEDWWIGHIMGTDKDYSVFFSDKNLD